MDTNTQLIALHNYLYATAVSLQLPPYSLELGEGKQHQNEKNSAFLPVSLNLQHEM